MDGNTFLWYITHLSLSFFDIENTVQQEKVLTELKS